MAQSVSVLILIGLNAASVFLARAMALHKARSPRLGMGSAERLGPLRLPLLWVLPPKRHPERA
jgi:hypothetical protein